MTGSVWQKIDLHIHTPASYDWDKSCKVTIEDIINKAEAEGLSLIAITDHHTVKSVDEAVKKAANKNITVLPGVELRTDKGNKGIHIIAVFDPSVSAKKIYDKLLCPLKLSEDDIKTKGDTQIYCDFEEACNLIHQLGGLVILHAGRKSNSIEELDSDLRAALKKDLSSLVDIFEVNSEKQAEEYKRIVFPNIKQEFPCIITSDAYPRTRYKKGHSIESIGKKFTWIKSENTFQGLKEIIYEPFLRVCLKENPPAYLHPQLLSLELDIPQNYLNTNIRVKDRFCLAKTKCFNFNPNLNSVIGGRATGKSTLLELISFIFGKHVVRKEHQKLTIIENLQVRYPDIKLKLNFKFGEKKYQVIKKLNQQEEIDLAGFDIIYLPQDEIEKKAESDEEITNLIKSLIEENRIRDKRASINQIRLRLEKFRNIYAQKFSKQKELKLAQEELKKIQLVLNFAQSEKYKSLVSNLSDKIKVREKINAVISNIEWQIGLLENICGELNESVDLDFSVANEFLQGERIVYSPQDTREKIRSIIKELRSIIEKIKRSTKYVNLINDLNELHRKYLQACKQLGIDTLNQKKIREALEAKSKIELRIRQLQQELRTIENAKQEHDKLIKRYKNLYKEYQELQKTLIESAREKFGKDLEITISENKEKLEDSIVDRFVYYQKKFGRLGLKEPDIRSIIHGLSIEKIIDYLTRREIPHAGTTQGHAHKLTAQFFFRDDEFIYREILIMNLKELLPENNFVIKFKGKKLHEMSFGERCGVVLRLILSNSNLPLIIDQPEDHLDNKYIVNELLDLIRTKKQERQIIFSTHNPNIVVNGDSELVIALELDSKTGYTVVREGALENKSIRSSITNILEGGEEAFLKRERKYNIKK